MDPSEFRSLFDDVARRHGFEAAHGGWFRDSEESTIVLDLQESSTGPSLDLNIKIFVAGLFGHSAFTRAKALVSREPGHIFRRQPPEHSDAFDLSPPLDRDGRTAALEAFFAAFLNQFAQQAHTREGLLNLSASRQVHLLPAVASALRGKSTPSA